MTPEERATKIKISIGCGCCFDTHDEIDNQAAIAKAIRAAIAEEREACAKIADENDGRWVTDGCMIAAAIRARP